MSEKLSRRRFLTGSAVVLGATSLAACAPKIVKETVIVTQDKVVEQTVVVKEAVEVEKEVTRVVEKAVEAPQAKDMGPWKVVVMYGRGEFSEKEQALAEEKYPSLTIEFLETDYTRFTAMIAAGNPPDYIRSVGLEMPYMVTRGVWEDMTPYMDTSTKLKWDDLHPINDLNKYQGGFYGIVKDWSPDFSLWMNLDYLAEAGVDQPSRDGAIPMDWVREASAKLTKKEGDRTLQFGYSGGVNVTALMKLLVPQGKSLYSDDFSVLNLRESQEAKAMIQYFGDWAKELTITSPLNPGAAGPTADFSNGLVAMIQAGYWFSGRMENAESGVKAQMFPTWSFMGEARYNPCGYGCSGSITRLSKVKEGAWLFNEYFMFEEPAWGRAKGGWGVPAFLSHFEMMPREGDYRGPLFELIMEQVKVALPAIPTNPYVKLATFNQPYGKYFELYIRDELTLDEFIGKVEDEVNTEIADSMKRMA